MLFHSHCVSQPGWHNPYYVRFVYELKCALFILCLFVFSISIDFCCFHFFINFSTSYFVNLLNVSILIILLSILKGRQCLFHSNVHFRYRYIKRFYVIIYILILSYSPKLLLCNGPKFFSVSFVQIFWDTVRPVSYTHLDVYKRQ